MGDTFRFGDIKPVEKTIVKTWNELRLGLAFGKIDGLEEAKGETFLKVFNDIFEINNMKRYILRHFGEYENLYRGAKLNDIRGVPLERFIPNSKYIKEDNRFSPPGVEWLYLSSGTSSDEAIQCCIQECRAKKGDWFGVCKFDAAQTNAKIADLTIGLDKSYDALNQDVNEEAETIAKNAAYLFLETGDQRYIYRNDLSFFYKKWLVPTYCKLISEQLFLPVNGAIKSLEYAPFQCMANYFRSIGFDGIIYKSTVYDKAKNIVLFDKNMAMPQNVQEFEI